MSSRTAGAVGTLERLRAVLTSPTIFALGQALTFEQRVGRPAHYPPYVLLQFGVLARLARSGRRAELDLSDVGTWRLARRLILQTLAESGYDLPAPGERPPTWEHWRWFRDHHLRNDEALADLGRAFPPLAVATARSIGQLHSDGPGSFTHPDPSRAVYGDGTIVRPLYRPPDAVRLVQPDGSTRVRYPHPRTGQLLEEPVGRFDADLAEHHGHRGSVLGHGYVAFHTRGPHPYQRVVLAVDHIPAPGMEAATAVDLLRAVARHARDGIQVVIYDGAFQGTHIETVMSRYGYLVIAKMPTGSSDRDPATWGEVRTPEGRRARSYPLGTVSHDLPTGPCAHQLATVGGRLVQVDLDESGDPVVTAVPRRGAVKRSRRAGGQYHFNVGYDLDCPYGPFTVWLSPHPGRDGDIRRPQNLRVLAEDDEDFLRLRGLRSDAESFHAQLKRTLIVDRAMSLGWRRGLIDVYCFALLNNALTEHRAAQHPATTRPSRRPSLRLADQ